MLNRSFLHQTLLAGAAALTFCAAPAQATPFQTGGYIYPPAVALNVHVDSPSTSYSGGDGEFSGIWDPAGAHLAINYFCYDLFHEFSPGTTYDYTASILETSGALSELFNEASATDPVSSAAFQLAIWAIEYDTGPYDLATGNFHVDHPGSGDALTAYNDAQSLLDNLSSHPGNHTIIFLQSTVGSQNFITDAVVPTQQNFTPEPGSLALLGIGMLAAMFTMRRRTPKVGRQ